MTCIYFGPHVGSLVTICCGGKEKLIPLHTCQHAQVSESFTVDRNGETGLALIEESANRRMAHVRSCHHCPHKEMPVRQREPMPAKPAHQNVSPPKIERSPARHEVIVRQRKEPIWQPDEPAAVQMWKELRQSKGKRERPGIEPLRFHTGWGVFAEDEYRHTSPTPPITNNSERFVRKHLLCHIWPVNNNRPVWMRHISRLRKALQLFNGQRTIAVATGDDTADPSEISELFDGAVDVISVPNTPLGEYETFLPLMRTIEGKPGITYRCHAKGVRHQRSPYTAVHAWADIMHEVCLDYMPLVYQSLEQHPITGVFLTFGTTVLYIGTFYWFRNDDVFSRKWQRIERHYAGTETWPGLHFNTSEAGCLLLSGATSYLNVYHARTIVHTVEPYLTWWRMAHQEWQTPLPAPHFQEQT